VRRTLPEISKAVSAYVLGQLILSTSFGIFTFIVLTLVGVEQALFLALLAAFMDAIPMIGVILATIPAVLLALTVSVPAAIIVFVAYIVYQQIENYVISPRVFGDRLKLSPFAILMAVLIGAELLGVLGVLMALPLAAAVPAIERIWIAPLKAGASAESAPETPPSPSDEQPRRSRRLAVPRKQR
jgi:predicted PurR-regulated permease PerM